MTALKIEYIDFLPEYLVLDPNRYAYIIDTQQLYSDIIAKSFISVY